MKDSPKKLVVESPSGAPPSEAEKFESRASITYKARIIAYTRLARRNVAWNSSIVAFSTGTTVASVGLLVDDQMYGRGGEALMVALAILSLVASLVVSNINYGSRAKAMEANYKQVQRIALDAERIKRGWTEDSQRISKITRKYEVAIETSENHSEIDYLRALDSRKTAARIRLMVDSFITISPYVSLIAPALIMVPFIKWFANGL